MWQSRELKPEYADMLSEFKSLFSDSGCTCFMSPPCGCCTHEGNPDNLDETPEAWQVVQFRPVSSRRAKYLKKRGKSKSIYYSAELRQYIYERIAPEGKTNV